MPSCSVEGCDKQATRTRNTICEMHYGRLRRSGTLDLMQRTELIHSHGYVLAYAPTHALRKQSPRVYKHRMVYYDAHGAGPFACHWCGDTVGWVGMHVDHVDFDKANNDITNLVAACSACNQWRDGTKTAERCKEVHGTHIEFRGERLCKTDWAKRLGITTPAVDFRLKHWPLAMALTATRRKYSRRTSWPESKHVGAVARVAA